MNNAHVRVPIGDGELSVVLDEPWADVPPAGRAIVVPPFGMSGERMFALAYLLTLNGFAVSRFDPRDHPGASSGTMATFRMSRLVEDIQSVVDLAGGGIVVAISLAARSVLRALRGTLTVEAAVLLTPVVAVRATVYAVTGYDWFDPVRYERSQLTRVLGYDVGTVMIRDCLEAGLENVEDAIADVLASSAPITFIAGDADPWARLDDVRAVASAAGVRGRDVELLTVPAASHQLYRNPALAMTFLELATRRCLTIRGIEPAAVRVPPFADILRALDDLKLSQAPAAPLGSRP